MALFGRTLLCALLLCLPPVVLSAQADDRDVEQERKELQDLRLKALQRLFRQQPDSQQVLESGVGYAVFSSAGLDLGLVSSRRGAGILRINRTGRDVFYKMVSASGSHASPDADFAVVIVYQSAAAIAQAEQDGWDVSVQSGEVGDLADTAMFPLTAAGVTLQEVIQGSRFVVDDELN